MMKYGFLCLLLPCVVHACSPPFEVAGQGCYFYSTDQGLFIDNYDGAVSLCKSYGGHLAIVKTQAENTAIVEHFFGASITDDKVLLGARTNDDEIFEWLDGALVIDTFDDWNEDQPSGNGECMGYSDAHDEFEWDDFQCEGFSTSGLNVGFICERPATITTTAAPSTTTALDTCTGHFEAAGDGCYYYSTDLGYIIDSYDAAASLCRADSGHLAIIKTLEENTAVVEHFLGATITDDKVLLGGRLNGDEVFEWVDGTLVEDSFYDWDEDQPSGNGECMGYSDEHEFEWDDFPCDDYLIWGLSVGFVCESVKNRLETAISEKELISDTFNEYVKSSTTLVPTTKTTTTATVTITSASDACTAPFEAAGSSCYYYSADQGLTVDSYDTAESFCQRDGGHLAIVKTQDENTAIVEHFLGNTITDDKVFLGGKRNDDGDFEWIDGTLVHENFDDWDEDQPSGNGDCMGYSDEHEFAWDDFPCDDFFEWGLIAGYICEDACYPPFESVGEGCYFYSADQGFVVDSYDAATTLCQQQGGHLAMVKTGGENRAILQHFFSASISDDKVLLGGTLNETGFFEWVDGTFVRDFYQSWVDCEPAGDGGCMGYSSEDGLLWDDFQCDYYNASGLSTGFLCQAGMVPITK